MVVYIIFFLSLSQYFENQSMSDSVSVDSAEKQTATPSVYVG